MDAINALLFDRGYEIKLRALEAKAKRDSAKRGTEEYSLHAGRVIAFGEVISLIRQTAIVLRVPLRDIRLDDIDPDADLL